jgi:hypothetical protein
MCMRQAREATRVLSTAYRCPFPCQLVGHGQSSFGATRAISVGCADFRATYQLTTSPAKF